MIGLILQYRRLIAYGLLALILSVCAWRVTAWRSAYNALPSLEAQLQAEVACQEGSACAARIEALKATQKAIEAGVVRDYENELNSLRNRPAPAGPVRLCRPARAGGVPGQPAAPATGPDGGPQLQVEVGADIAAELYRLADDADAEALKLKYLWARDQALSTPPATE